MLPGPYERWYAEVLGRPFPTEPRSTCAECAMAPGAPDLPPDGSFVPEVRCCTYQPHLAPYLVGALVADGNPLIRARLAGRDGVTPLGLAPPAGYAATYQRALADPRAFGRSLELRCQYLDGDRCGIWRWRGMSCAAYHCKYDRGALGAGLWNLLGVVTHMVERALRRWLLRRHDLQPDACDALLRDPEAYERAWGAWLGREPDYFVACARLVDDLKWADVEQLGGGEVARLAGALRAALDRLDAREVPEVVRRGPDVLHRIGRPGTVRLQHPGVPNDLVEVPAAVAATLAGLDGPAALATLGLEPDLVRRLLDWQALTP